MESFSFSLPTAIEFGRGAVSRLAEHITAGNYVRPMFVTDKGLIDIGFLEPLTDLLRKASIEYYVFSDTVPNPRDYDCDKGAEYAKEVDADVLIAVGGGSAMDTAKAIATVMTNKGSVRDWFDVELDTKSAPVICIPTTCGTGSEVTFNAVITDTRTNLKANVFDPKCAPVLAIVDPDVLTDLPKHLVSSTGMDAMTHAIEAYVSTVATPMTDIAAASAIKEINGNIKKAALNGDRDALDHLMFGSMLAGIAFGNADTAAVHCISECFGGFYDMPHGVTNTIFLSTVSKHSIPGNPKKYREVAEMLGVDTSGLTDEDGAMKGIGIINSITTDLNIPPLKEFTQVNPKDFEYLAEASSKHVCNPSNPVEFSKEQYLTIFNEVYGN